MTRTYKTRQEESIFLDTLTCNRCGFTVTRSDDDVLEWQEFMMWRNLGSYGSVFGDGNLIELDLCQRCVKELLGEYVRVVDSEL